MEFCHVPKFDYIIIWYILVDLLKLDLKKVIISCPHSRSFCYDATPSGSLLIPVVIILTGSLQHRQLNGWWLLTDSQNFQGHWRPTGHTVNPSKALSCFAPFPLAMAVTAAWALSSWVLEVQSDFLLVVRGCRARYSPWAWVSEYPLTILSVYWWKTSRLLARPLSLGGHYDLI